MTTDNGPDFVPEIPAESRTAIAYESPRVEAVLTAAELAREIKYAGDTVSVE